jgi:two-component system LytT family sensor kinase
MKTSNKIFTSNKLKGSFLVAIKITLVFGLFFFIVNGEYSIKALLVTMGVSAMYSFTLGFGQGLMNEYLGSKWSWVANTKERVLSGVLATIFYTVPVILVINYILFIVIQEQHPSVFFEFPMVWIHLFWIIFSFGVSAFLHARGFMLEWKKEASAKSTKQEIVAKTETAKFESLKNQIDPHFLFNSLNVLTSLIGENPKQAERFTTKLSKVYRYVLEQRNKELIPLSEELKFASAYMELLQMRFEDAIQFEIPSEISNDALKIVPLSLQLLLENAVKHNVVSSNKPLVLRIFEENGSLIIENNVNPKEAIGKSTKIGLRNITDRYRLITKRNVSIINDKITFRVSLPLLTKNNNNNMYTEEIQNSSYVRAIEKVKKLKEFYQNITSYCIVIPFLVFINLYTSPQFHWFWFPMFGWGIGILFHGLDVYNYNPILGRDWERNKINELMQEEDDMSNWE